MANTEVGAAYVTIMPNLKGFGRELRSGVEGSIGALGKGIAAATGAMSAAIGAVGAAAVGSYSQYEQLVGGVEKLFKESAPQLQEYAAGAYKTAGLSTNEYMRQATSFSSSLIRSCQGDVSEAASLTDVAMRSMSDNVNTFGSSMESVQDAYQGFAKQNYTMLDNLKLGYGGTQKEMQRLIADASKMTDVQAQLGLTVDGSSMSFANIVKAIQVMQTSMGIAGTTTNEAATTIEGATTMMKASWSNWLTGLAVQDADIVGLTEQLVDSVVTVISLIGPRAAQVFTGVANALPPLLGQLSVTLPQTIVQIGAAMASSLAGVLSEIGAQANGWLTTELPSMLAWFNAFAAQHLPDFLNRGIDSLVSFSNGVMGALPQLINSATVCLTSFISSIASRAPQLVQTALTLMMQFISSIMGNLPKLVSSGMQLLAGLVKGIMDRLPSLISQAPVIIGDFCRSLAENFPSIVQSGVQIITSVLSGLWNAIPAIYDAVPSMFQHVIDIITNINWGDVGRNIIEGIKNGITGAARSLCQAAANAAGDALQWVKDKLGIHSPSRVFRDQVGKMIPAGIEVGLEKATPSLVRTAGDMASTVIGRVSGIGDRVQEQFDAVPTAFDAVPVSVRSVASQPAGQPAGSGESGRTITQTININQPVRSPDELARYMRLQERYGLAASY